MVLLMYDLQLFTEEDDLCLYNRRAQTVEILLSKYNTFMKEY